MTKSQADAQLQSAALRHYAVMCREKARGAEPNSTQAMLIDDLNGLAERADKLAHIYDLVAEGA